MNAVRKFKYVDIITTSIGGALAIALGILLWINKNELKNQNMIKNIDLAITFGAVLVAVGIAMLVATMLFVFVFRNSSKRHWTLVLLSLFHSGSSIFGTFYIAVPKSSLMYINGRTIFGAVPLQFIVGTTVAVVLFLVILAWKVFVVGFQIMNKNTSKDSLRKLFHIDIRQVELKKVLPDRLAAKTDVLNEDAYAKNEFRVVTRPYSHPLYKRISPEREAVLGHKRQSHEQKLLSRQEKTREIQRKQQYKLFERAQNNFKNKRGG